MSKNIGLTRKDAKQLSKSLMMIHKRFGGVWLESYVQKEVFWADQMGSTPTGEYQWVVVIQGKRRKEGA